MKYHFEEHALQELRDAIAYYDKIDSGLGVRFRAAIKDALSAIRQFPNAWPKLSASTRRRRTKRFPYGILYRVKNDEIEIVAVAHFSREPHYWVDRL